MKLVVIIIIFVTVMIIMIMIIIIIITIIIYLFTFWLWAKASHFESLSTLGESLIYNYRIPMNFPRLRLLLVSFILGAKWKHIELGISQLTRLDLF